MKISSIMFRLAIMLLLFGSSMNGRAASDVRKPENRVIYEVFVRNFSPAGNLKGVVAQVPRLKELGVDVVWLMPIYKLGDTGKWGTYSSPYAVKDYTKIDPDNGTEQDLRDLVKTIHDNGMEIWFDWVANHTSMDNVWVSSHPEFYKKNGGEIVHPNGWNDVYQLDSNSTAMQDEMIKCMQYWVENFDIDGFRCDYASGPSPELWRKASEQVLKNGKRVAWLAEDDSRPELVSNGYFDYNYAWGFRDRLLDQVRGVNINNLKNECAKLHNDNNYKGRSRMVYLSNHDVVQDEGGTEEKHFGKLLRPMTVLEFTVYGMPLLYNGQEIQYKSGQVLLSEKTPINWNNLDNEMTALIKTLCNLKHTQPALNTGKESGVFLNHEASNDKVYVYERRNGNETVVVMLNFGDSQASFTVTGSLPGINAVDVFSGKKAQMVSGGSFTLPAYGYAVYVADDESGETPVIPDLPKTPGIYVRDLSGWDNLYVYAYQNDATSLFGNWPGAIFTQEVTMGGVTYKKVEYPMGYSGEHNLIFTNNSGAQFDGPAVPATEDLFIEITDKKFTILDPPVVSDEKYNIYINDQTGWADLYLYAYRNDAPSLFGGWPGHYLAETEVIDGTTYKVVRNVEATEDAHHFILHNNAGTQYDVEEPYVINNHIFLDAGPTGVMTAVTEFVDADEDAGTEFYTMQGVRVANPSAPGLYIVKKGKNVSKVLLNSF
ncbi:MAG: starch-binding protein [Muribaculaceae bacterium]|nr:starch-binding protein [Muribaculaceae bacterium]